MYGIEQFCDDLNFYLMERFGYKSKPTEINRISRLLHSDTKNGKQRVIRITSKLSSYLRSQAFPTNTDRLFDTCRSAFRKALERTSIELPQGQSTHVLRYTYASHFVMKGGDILTLKNTLGHPGLKLIMRYAHLSLDYMQQAVELSSLDF